MKRFQKMDNTSKVAPENEKKIDEEAVKRGSLDATIQPDVAPAGTRTSGNTKDNLLYDYGLNQEVFGRDEIVLYGGDNQSTDKKIGDNKPTTCQV